MLMLSYKLKGQKSPIIKIALVHLFGRWYIRTQSVAEPVFSFNFGKDGFPSVEFGWFMISGYVIEVL